jgi:hypothetical protein
VNLRAEAYGELARRLDPEGPWAEEPWALPADPLLREELVAPEKIFSSDGLAFRLTPKHRHPGANCVGETLREKLGRSPDTADAVAYLYHAGRAIEVRRAWRARYEGDLCCSSADPRDDEMTAEDWATCPQELREIIEMSGGPVDPDDDWDDRPPRRRRGRLKHSRLGADLADRVSLLLNRELDRRI